MRCLSVLPAAGVTVGVSGLPWLNGIGAGPAGNERDREPHEPTAALHRTGEEVTRFFDGTDVVEPGLVWVEGWRPDPGSDDTRKSFSCVNVG
jgi:hypothetical protein